MSAAFDAFTRQMIDLRADMIRRLNADIFTDGGTYSPHPVRTEAETSRLRRERLQRLVQVRDIEDDWDY